MGKEGGLGGWFFLGVLVIELSKILQVQTMVIREIMNDTNSTFCTSMFVLA